MCASLLSTSRSSVLEVCRVYGKYSTRAPTSPRSASSLRPRGVPCQSSPLKITSKRSSRQLSNLSAWESTTTSSTSRRPDRIATRSAKGITGGRPFIATTTSSVTTPTTSRSQRSRALTMMFRCPM